MIEVVRTIQYLVAVVCIVALVAILGGAAVVKLFAPAWQELRRWASLGLIQMTLVAVIVGGFVQYGSTKSGFQWDTGLTDNGSYTTNNLVHIAWTYSGIPADSTIYIDYKRQSGAGTNWTSLAESVASALQWNGTLANATNCDFYIYSAYVPPVPVHTNGVWVGQAYETKQRKGAQGFVIINGKIINHGATIAPPVQKRKDEEE